MSHMLGDDEEVAVVAPKGTVDATPPSSLFLESTAIAPGFLVLSLLDGSVMCLDTENGEILWALQGDGMGGPLVNKTEKTSAVKRQPKQQPPMVSEEESERGSTVNNAESGESGESSTALVPVARNPVSSNNKSSSSSSSHIPQFVAGFGTSKDSLFIRSAGGELTPADHLRSGTSFTDKDYIVTNSVDHVYLEVRLNSGEVVAKGMDDLTTPTVTTPSSAYPSTPTSSVGGAAATTTTTPTSVSAQQSSSGPVIAILRTNKIMKCRKRNIGVSWTFSTGDVSLSTVQASTPTVQNSKVQSLLAARNNSNKGSRFSSSSANQQQLVIPKPEVFVTGDVEVYTATGEFLWSFNAGQEIFKAYYYSDAIPLLASSGGNGGGSETGSYAGTPTGKGGLYGSGGDGSATSSPSASMNATTGGAAYPHPNSPVGGSQIVDPLVELKIRVCSEDERQSAMIFNDEANFVFTKGSRPALLNVDGFEDSQAVCFDESDMTMMTGSGGNGGGGRLLPAPGVTSGVRMVGNGGEHHHQSSTTLTRAGGGGASIPVPVINNRSSSRIQSIPTSSNTGSTPLSAGHVTQPPHSATTNVTKSNSMSTAEDVVLEQESTNNKNGTTTAATKSRANSGWTFDGVDDTTVGSNSSAEEDDYDDEEDDDDAETTISSQVPTQLHANPSFFANNFEIKGLLGQGAGGLVVLCSHKVTRLLYAVKAVPVRDQASEELALREVRLHAQLSHQNIVRYFNVWSEDVGGHMLSPTPQRPAIGGGPQRLAITAGGMTKSGSGSGGGGHRGLSESGIQEKLKAAALAAGNEAGGHLALGMGPNGDLLLGDSITTAGGCTTTNGGRGDDEGSDCCSDATSTTANTETRHGPVTKTLFLQLEYCTTSLAHWMANRARICREDNLNIAAQLVDGLRYLHRQGVVHRDLKPANVFMKISDPPIDGYHPGGGGADDSSNPISIKLGDFGLAKLPAMSQSAEYHLDPEGALSAFAEARNETDTHTRGVGTPLYSSPEQLAGKMCSPESDIYSLGMLLLELYLIPTTASERIVYLERIRAGKGIQDPEMESLYPELKVALQMVDKDPKKRPSLAVLKKGIKTFRTSGRREA